MKRELEGVKCYAFDLDGTLYLDGKLFDGVPNTLARLRENARVCYLTNNSSRTKAAYLSRLQAIGLEATADDIFTSQDAAMLYMRRTNPNGGYYIVACDDVVEEFREAGFRLTDVNPDACILAFDTTLNYQKLYKLCHFITHGAKYIVTHPDVVCPHPDTPLPDVGSFVELIYAATGRRPDAVCGKPYGLLAESIMDKYGVQAGEIAMVGDRLATDIRFGTDNGLKSVLVLSGVTDIAEYRASGITADLVLNSVNELI